jgi:hypothetical protein
MGWVAPAVAIASAGIGVVSAMSQSAQAEQQAQDSKTAAAKQTAEIYSEVGRQQTEVNRIAAEQKSDRIRAANLELAATRVAALERGVSGTTMSALIRNLAYLEGADLTRVESNRLSNIEAGEATKRSAKNGYIESVTIADNQKAAAQTSAWLGAAGSGLQIAGNYFQNSSQLNAMQNRRV